MCRTASLFVLFAMLITAPVHAQDAVAERGMKVYADSKCSICHSVGGKGNAKGLLDEIGTKLSADEIRLWVTDPQAMRDKTHAERKPIMKSYATLSKGDLDALVAYLQTLKKK